MHIQRQSDMEAPADLGTQRSVMLVEQAHERDYGDEEKHNPAGVCGLRLSFVMQSPRRQERF